MGRREGIWELGKGAVLRRRFVVGAEKTPGSIISETRGARSMREEERREGGVEEEVEHGACVDVSVSNNLT